MLRKKKISDTYNSFFHIPEGQRPRLECAKTGRVGESGKVNKRRWVRELNKDGSILVPLRVIKNSRAKVEGPNVHNKEEREALG